jgi:uncharacterized protein YutD
MNTSEKEKYIIDLRNIIKTCELAIELSDNCQLRDMTPEEKKRYKELLGDYDFIIGVYKIKKLVQY